MGAGEAAEFAPSEAEEVAAPDADSADAASDVVTITTAVDRLREKEPALANSLLAVFEAVVEEAARSRRFANALRSALTQDQVNPESPSSRRSRKTTTRASKLQRPSNRRAPGVLDPFAVYMDGGDAGLRGRLRTLGLEQLRDIVAAHGMDNDRLAMKWKDEERVIERIVERVVARSEKGSAFRDPS
jgi:hypothetical protein